MKTELMQVKLKINWREMSKNIISVTLMDCTFYKITCGRNIQKERYHNRAEQRHIGLQPPPVPLQVGEETPQYGSYWPQDPCQYPHRRPPLNLCDFHHCRKNKYSEQNYE